MPAPPLSKPDLYSEGPEGPFLKGGKCVCGYVFFPFQSHGCERCGAHGDDLRPADLRGSGRLVSTATVHVHHGKERQAPFDVGVIELDDGPVVRTLLTNPAAPGDRVEAVFVDVPAREGGQTARDLRFEVRP